MSGVCRAGWLLLWLAVCTAYAQPRRLVQGYLRDSLSGEAIIGATVAAPAIRGQVITDRYGFFQLPLPERPTTLQVRAAGYQPRTLPSVAGGDTLLSLYLQPVPRQIDSVRIEAAAAEPPSLGRIQLSAQTVEAIPTLLGEADLLKAVQLLPGVQSGTEGSSGLYVRGGTPDQNLILLDGVPVYNVAHALSLFSIFNPAAINQVSLYKGSIPARYGGRLSSVLDISLKEGNRRRFGGEAALGLISGKVMLEGPIRWGQSSESEAATSFLVSGRRTWLDLLAGPIQRLSNPGGARSNYFFHDLTAKVNHRFAPGNELYASFYTGRDRLNLQAAPTATAQQERTDLQWGNLTGVLRWNRLLGGNLYSQLTAYVSNYRFRTEVTNQRDTLVSALRFQSRIREYALQWDLSRQVGLRHHLRGGLRLARQRFDPGAVQLQGGSETALNLDSALQSQRILPWQGAIYLEDDFRLHPRLTLRAGLRGTAFWVRDRDYYTVQPRAALTWRLSDWLSLQAGYTRQVQFLHLLTSTAVSLPLDLWVPATDRVPPQQAWQSSLGLSGQIGPGWEWSVEGYYKAMTDVIEFEEGANFLVTGPEPRTLAQTETWERQVARGEGTSYGAEWYVRRTQGRSSGWISYTLSWTQRQFPTLNGGAPFPFAYDRRHNLVLVYNQRFTPRFHLNATWRWRSGQRMTLPVASFDVPDPLQPSGPNQNRALRFGSRNGYQLPAFHRLDVSLSWRKAKPWGQRTWQVGLYNAYSRLNPFTARPLPNRQPPQVQLIGLLPVLPFVSYQADF